MQTVAQQLSFPPLTPFLGASAGGSPWGAASAFAPSMMVPTMSSFLLPSFVLPASAAMAVSRGGLPTPTPSPSRVPRSSSTRHQPRQPSHHQHQQHHYHCDVNNNHHSPVLPSPTGSPRLCRPTTVVEPTATLPPLRPWLSSAAAAVGPEVSMLLAFRPPSAAGPRMPALPCWGSVSLPTSPVSSAPSSPTNAITVDRAQGAKRKRAASVPPTGRTTPTQTKSEVTFANGAQVSKWKLNGPRYKRCKVTDASGADQWKKCHHCGTDSTPEWRNGPLGKGTLCNACGLRYRSKQREQTSRGQSGNVPVSLLLNPESNKKGRTNINNPMIWETKLASFPTSEAAVNQPQQRG